MKTVKDAQLDNARLYYAYARLALPKSAERRQWIRLARQSRAIAKRIL